MKNRAGGVLLFLFALATFAFVAYVWVVADNEQPNHPIQGDTPTLPTTVAPAVP